MKSIVPSYARCLMLLVLGFLTGWVNLQAQSESNTYYGEVLKNSSIHTYGDAIILPHDDVVNRTLIRQCQHGTFTPNHSWGANEVEVFGDYTPDAGYVGLDTAILEMRLGAPLQMADLYYLTFVFDVRESIVTVEDEYVHIVAPYAPLNIDVLANDFSTHGDVNLASVIAYSGGVVFPFGNQVWFLPDASQPGIQFIHYVVCDDLGACKQGQVHLSIEGDAAQEDTLRLVTGMNASLKKMLDTDGYVITSQPTYGQLQLAANGGRFTYTAFNGTGLDAFTLARGGQSLVVEVDVVSSDTRSVVQDDYAFTAPNDSLLINVKSNDLGQNFSLSSHSEPLFGTLVPLGDGEFLYVADSTFVGVDRFEYTTCALQNCETAEVLITVNPYAPHPASSHQITGTRNREILVNYEVPVDDYTFEIAGFATHGVVTILDGQQAYTNGCVTSTGRFMIRYVPDTGFTGDDEFEVEYCNEAGCQTITIEVLVLDQSIYDTCNCLDQCVWPGDIDNNGIVTRDDYLSLAYIMGYTGTTRPWAEAFSWFGQNAPDWGRPTNVKWSTDLKYADANGDGVISMDDAEIVTYHLGSQQGILHEDVPVVRPYSFDLEILSDSVPSIGDTIAILLHVGNTNQPIDHLLGVGMELSFDPLVFDSAYTHAALVQENWLNQGSFPMNMIEKDGLNFNLLTSKINQSSATGYGPVYVFNSIIDDQLDGVRLSDNRFVSYVDISNIRMMDGDGRLVSVPNQRLPLVIQLKDDAPLTTTNELSVYPNPTQDVLNFQADIPLKQVQIFNAVGQLVRVHDVETTSRVLALPVHGMVAGSYIVRAESIDGEIYTSRFVKL